MRRRAAVGVPVEKGERCDRLTSAMRFDFARMGSTWESGVFFYS
jgi:hypothetical protein